MLELNRLDQNIFVVLRLERNNPKVEGAKQENADILFKF